MTSDDHDPSTPRTPVTPVAIRPPRRRRPWSTRREWATWPVVVARLVLVVIAATLFAVAAPVTAVVYDVPVPLALLVTAVLSVSLGLAPVLPRTASVAHLVAVAALGVMTTGGDVAPWPLPVTAIVGLGVLVVVLGVRTDWRLTAAVWTAATVLTLALVAVAPSRWEPADVWASTFVVSAGSTLLLAGAAVAIGQRRAVRVELAEARRDVELEQERRRTVEERARIARELHDVVAHSMSVVHMQAESAPYRVQDLPPEARAEFAAIAGTSRTALREMRQLLGTLRGGADAERAPQPQLTDLPDLVERTRAAGIPVTLHLDAAHGDEDRLAQLTVYRVVQEALGNVARHASGASTVVTVGRHGAALRVEVTNHAPSAGTLAAPPPDDGGFGLAGMRERVAALGGTIEHGPQPDGGYRVAVSLPTTPASSSTTRADEEQP
ncbi:sensor histidine kinase [Curtobacterium sp. 1P10AnD]|uniref:sensor histidine kinase n=1 Tax=Curtobacterium sp. 1P10AnD TaxID=3132283 RepID=UPI0039A3F390